MKKISKRIVSVLLVLAMLLSVTACGKDKKEIENLITEFEYACNVLDINAVLDCLEPKVAEKIKVAASVVGLFTEMSSEELFEYLGDYLVDDSVQGTDFFSSISIEIEEIEEEDGYAAVYVILEYDLLGETSVREAVFECIYYTEKWFISDLIIL